MFFFSTAKSGLGSALATAQERHKAMISASGETTNFRCFQSSSDIDALDLRPRYKAGVFPFSTEIQSPLPWT
jgi:hypothetical protein